MKTAPICPAALSSTAEGVPFAPLFDDIYHPRAGALDQARQVFLAGNGLPDRWSGRERFVVLETGFGLGNNFLAAWDAWRNDPKRCERLHFVSIEKHPLQASELSRLHAASPLAGLAAQLVSAWPPPVHTLHRLAFEQGRVQLLLAFGDVAAWLPEIVARVDAFDLDGFAPRKNPAMWERRVFRTLARLAAPGATAATWSVAREVREGLFEAGFDVAKAAGFGTKREMTVAHHAPRFMPRRPPARAASPPGGERHAVIVGAGLAGCASAFALAEQGWTSLVIDRHPHPAGEASGNLAGLFHGSVHPEDGVHARFNRAAAFEIGCWMREHGGDAGSANGVLRLETGRTIDAMRSIVARLGLPHSFVRAVDAGEAEALCGLASRFAAWWFPHGGWARPRRLCESWIAAAAGAVSFRGGVEVHALGREGARWHLLDARGGVVAQAGCVVLANAADALRLIGNPDWPLRRVRGQVSSLPASALGPLVPRCPVAGAGYALPPVDGRVVFGATTHACDHDASVRAADQQSNLASLRTLTGWGGAVQECDLDGRVGWRLVADDRLPLIGAVPVPPADALHARFVAREPGLYLYTALASRGITWSLLGARVLASLASGAPCPIEASLLDAVDPARFAVRRARRARPAAALA